MLANPKEILLDAQKNNYAIAGINATTFEALAGMIEAAEELDAPIMISHAQSHEPYAPIDVFGPLFIDFARKAKVPVIVHLDHGHCYEYVMKAIRNGFTSIMYDCATLPHEENLAEVKKFTQLAHSLGIIVEAALEEMPSNIVGQGGCTEFGGDIGDITQYYTKPDIAASFVKETGIDMLTVSFGTIHGLFVKAPNLDLELLKRINDVTECALVMHGGSGVEEDQMVSAIDCGMRKVNYHTGMATATTDDIKKLIDQAKEPVYFQEIAEIGKLVMKERAKHIIQLLQNK